MKSYFTSNEHWLPETITLSDKIRQALLPIYKAAQTEGYSLRELHYLIEFESIDLHLSLISGWEVE